MNYYEHHLGDYARDAGHLSMIEDGAYRRLLDAYYGRESELPLDIAECQKLAKCRTSSERKAVIYVLVHFFQKRESGYRHKRCDEELQKAKARIHAARENGRKGGRPKNPEGTHWQPTGLGFATPGLTQPITQEKALHIPHPTSHIPKEEEKKKKRTQCADASPPFDPGTVINLDSAAWNLWTEHRVAKRKPIKPHSMQIAAEQLAALGSDQMAEVRRAIAGDWQGLHPAEKAKINGAQPYLTKFERATAHLEKEDQGFG